MTAPYSRRVGCAISTRHRAGRRLGAFEDVDVPEVDLSTRHGLLRGRLVRRETWILAEQGPALGVEAAFWVSLAWSFGCVLGYSGLLERIRIALDPATNRFHFGIIED